jgi:hypothetical protein
VEGSGFGGGFGGGSSGQGVSAWGKGRRNGARISMILPQARRLSGEKNAAQHRVSPVVGFRKWERANGTNERELEIRPGEDEEYSRSSTYIRAFQHRTTAGGHSQVGSTTSSANLLADGCRMRPSSLARVVTGGGGAGTVQNQRDVCRRLPG